MGGVESKGMRCAPQGLSVAVTRTATLQRGGWVAGHVSGTGERGVRTGWFFFSMRPIMAEGVGHWPSNPLRKVIYFFNPQKLGRKWVLMNDRSKGETAYVVLSKKTVKRAGSNN